MSEVFLSKGDRVNPNLLAAGGSLIVGDSAPGDHGEKPGEKVRVNANAQGAAQAVGASTIADKVTPDQLHDLALKAEQRGDQQGSMALLGLEKSMRAGDVAKTSAHAMARQTARYLKRQQMTSIESAAPSTNVDVVQLLRSAAKDENWPLLQAVAEKLGKRAAGNPALTSICTKLAALAKSRAQGLMHVARHSNTL
jgi:hypothetical protein